MKDGEEFMLGFLDCTCTIHVVGEALASTG